MLVTKKPASLIALLSVLAIAFVTMPPADSGPVISQALHKRMMMDGGNNPWDEPGVIWCEVHYDSVCVGLCYRTVPDPLTCCYQCVDVDSNRNYCNTCGGNPA